MSGRGTVAGRLVAFEGGEGCGKSTQARLLGEHLGAVVTHEPGATTIGASIRRLLLDPATEGMDDRTEALLMAADRAQHVAEVIRPALAAGRHVVTDRFAGSSLAYQGYGRGLDLEEVRGLSAWATGGLWPDVVVLLEVPPEVAEARMGVARDRMEQAGEGFHARVAAGFRSLAADDPTWVVIDGTGPPDDVAARVRAAVATRGIIPG